MTPTRQYAKKQAKAIKRRPLNAKERHERQQNRPNALSKPSTKLSWTWACPMT
jgi:tRNA A37 N6-isopentenylltransferase MiaA